MASDEAKVRVRLDTRQAKADLRGLGKEGAAASGRISGRLGGGRGGGGGFGLGAALGGGVGLAVGSATGLVKRSMMGPVGDVIGQKLEGPTAMFDLAVGGPEARGAGRALQQTQGLFKTAVGETGDVSGATQYFEAIKKLRVKEEVGAAAIKAELGGGAKETREAVSKITIAIRAGFSVLKHTIKQYTSK